VYLEAAVDKHVRIRAEEIASEARKIGPKVAKVVAGIRPVPEIRRITQVEVLGMIYRDLRRHKRARAVAGVGRQMGLFEGAGATKGTGRT
jgi:hypothetical protein